MRYRFHFVRGFLGQNLRPPTPKCQPRPFTATGIPSCTLLLTMASALAGAKGPTLVDWGIVPSDGLISGGDFLVADWHIARMCQKVVATSVRSAVCRILYACSLLFPAGKFALLYAGGLALFALAKILESRRHESPLSRAHAACLLWRRSRWATVGARGCTMSM